MTRLNISEREAIEEEMDEMIESFRHDFYLNLFDESVDTSDPEEIQRLHREFDYGVRMYKRIF